MGKKGLTDIEVKESREKNGANIIPDSVCFPQGRDTGSYAG